eukprot:TRINITY_DN15680_c0_g1_i1.p1 TRINITY_DN15680_c0_g1~~TRINITY_DN15680_c0_g1_i1.p1  ORF type:complete len:208 (+),score=51.04 TRINITY_DN15680_c0_g1_i1:88-711(+)
MTDVGSTIYIPCKVESEEEREYVKKMQSTIEEVVGKVVKGRVVGAEGWMEVVKEVMAEKRTKKKKPPEVVEEVIVRREDAAPSSPLTDLETAAKTGDSATVHRILVTNRLEDTSTALHLAISHGHARAAVELYDSAPCLLPSVLSCRLAALSSTYSVGAEKGLEVVRIDLLAGDEKHLLRMKNGKLKWHDRTDVVMEAGILYTSDEE